MKLKPMADNLLLKQHEAAQTTVAGIMLATSTKDRPPIFDVVAAGPKCEGIAAGDKVVVDRSVGTDVKMDGADYKFVKLDDVLAVVTD